MCAYEHGYRLHTSLHAKHLSHNPSTLSGLACQPWSQTKTPRQSFNQYSRPSIRLSIQPFTHLLLTILTNSLMPLECHFIKVKFLICLSCTMHHFLHLPTQVLATSHALAPAMYVCVFAATSQPFYLCTLLLCYLIAGNLPS